MATVAEIAYGLAERTHPDRAPEWDPVGLQLGDPGSAVDRIAVCHEVTEEVVARVENDPIDMLVTYHPLIFTPTNRLLAGRSPGARSYRLITTGVSLLVTHTDFDAAPGGTADALADFFDLVDVTPFGGDPESGLADIGRHGRFQGSLGTIDAILTDHFGPIGIRISGDRDAEVDKVAVVPGSGGAFVESASQVAQVLVTGDVPHHRAVVARDLGLSIADPGHIATERPGMAALAEMVRDVSGGEVVDLTGIDPQTWD